MELIWIPLKSVGPFQFYDDIDKYVREYNIEYVNTEKYCDGVNWDIYEIPSIDNIEIDTEKKKIISINCKESCIYNGINLIGLPLEKVIELLGFQPEKDVDSFEMADGSTQLVYEFDDFGAQVWTTEDGIVVTVICSTLDEEDESE